MATVHILTQYVWPDAAPTGLYAEQLAIRLKETGSEVRLVGGRGGYRALRREKPEVPLLHLDHWQGRRGNLLQTFAEYASVTRAFGKYIASSVRAGDTVIVSSAPPNTVCLVEQIRRRGARSVYWLQDYYPELIRGLREYSASARTVLRKMWDHQLTKWERVVKIGSNLGGPKRNVVVIRNWPTFIFPYLDKPEPKTALYLGNLGYGHDVGLLVRACDDLRDNDYRISIRADGPGVALLPAWLKAEPVCKSVAESREALLRHEIHLIAAHPKIEQAIFPSKIWNSFAAKRETICTGFSGEMAEELRNARIAPFARHLAQWVEMLQSMERGPAVSTHPSLGSRRLTPEMQPVAVGR